MPASSRMSRSSGRKAPPSDCTSFVVCPAVDADGPKKYARRSLSMPTTSKPAPTKWRTLSEPTRPPEPVTTATGIAGHRMRAGSAHWWQRCDTLRRQVTDLRSGGIEELDRVREGDALELARGSVAVCIPVFGAHELFVQCLRSVLRCTPEDIVVLVADDASVDRSSERFLDELCTSGALHHRLLYLSQPHNVGSVRNVNSALALLAPADVVVLNSDCIVGPESLQRLRAAATSVTTIATASALTNNATILSVPGRNEPQPDLPEHLDVEQVARLVANRSLRLRPRIPTAIGHCMYLRRHALELVGDFDTAFSPGYGEEVDFSQRCRARGFAHIAADDVFVYHRGAGSFNEISPLQEAHERVVRARHPFYHDAVRGASASATGALPRAIASAATALRQPSVTIDARFLGGAITGTQLQALELIHALWRTQRVDL